MKKYLPKILTTFVFLACLVGIIPLNGCADKDNTGYKKNKDLDTSKEVKLVIASSSETWPEMDNIITGFQTIYPNCTVSCEYIDSYLKNIATRLEQTEQKIDIFRSANVQKTTDYRESCLNLISEESKKILDLSDNHKGLVDNFKYPDAENTQYAIPYGGEMRGMYVNVTLLKKYNLKVPTKRSELLACCEKLYSEGYIPFQSSNGTFAQQLLYPYICNLIVNGGNYTEMYQKIENIDVGISEYFRDPYAFLYDIVEKGYFDYKRVEEELKYTFAGSESKAKEFLNIAKKADETYEKVDDVGKIAFLPDTQAFESYLAKAKSDYYSNIEYKFITSPVGVDGGYAYLSPSDGLAINKNSDHVDWSLEFLNYLFTSEINTTFAEASGKIPNTKDALLKYDSPDSRSCDVGQVTFSYNFYKVITPGMLGGFTSPNDENKEVVDMIGISKMNADKYMVKNDDDSLSLAFTLDEYIARLESEFQEIKAARSN